MELSNRPAVPDDVMARQLGEETVLLDLASGTYFGLDAVGTCVWRLIEEGRSLAEVCEAMMETHEVSREEIERDVLALAEELRARGLIRLG